LSRIVIDANVALDWMIPSQQGNEYSLPLVEFSVNSGIEFLVPLHFDVEVTRVLRKQYKRNPDTFTKEWFDASLQALDAAEFQVVAQGINLELLGKLSEVYNLDVPDVPYFHLARTLEIPIATRDKGIITACNNWNVAHWSPQ
jgi:predicted nucleic acid-binding protein